MNSRDLFELYIENVSYNSILIYFLDINRKYQLFSSDVLIMQEQRMGNPIRIRYDNKGDSISD